MFELQRAEAAVFGSARRVIKRSVALEKRDYRRRAVEREQFAESPNAAAIERVRGSAARIPRIAKLFGVEIQLEMQLNFEGSAEARANVIAVRDVKNGSAAGRYALL